MKELVEYIVGALVDHPEQVQVNEVAGERSTVYEVRVADDDLGRVIGKGGRIANSIRALVKAAGSKGHRHVWVDFGKQGEESAPPAEPAEEG